MKFRPVLFALPVTLVAAAGFAWVAASANAAGNGPLEVAGFETLSGDHDLLAQAPPPPAGSDARRERPGFSPRAMCQEQIARRVGQRAYLKARLDLKPDQMATWTAFEKSSDDAGAKQMARCATLPAEGKMPGSLTDRINMQEEAMKARLDSIQAVKPSLFALYAALTPEQKAIVDRGSDRRMGDRPGRGPG